MKRKTKIYLSSLSGLIIVGSVLGSTLPIYLNKNDQVHEFKSSVASNIHKQPYAYSGPMFMSEAANCSLNNALLQSISNSNNSYTVWSNQLNQNNFNVVLNSNIKSTSNNPITYNYYATNVQPSNMSQPSGGVLIKSNLSTPSLTLNRLDLFNYKYWYVVANQTVNKKTYSLTTNTITFDLENGPITFKLNLSKSINPISNELVSGFQTLSINNVQLSSKIAHGGTYTYSFYGSNQNELYVTNHLLNTSDNNSNTYTLNQNQFRCNYKYYFAQVQYTYNNQTYVANSNWISNDNVNLSNNTATPISSVVLSINDGNSANVSLDQTSGFPTLSTKVTSSLPNTSGTSICWYATNTDNNALGMPISGVSGSSFTLTKTQIEWLSQNQFNYIFCKVYETNANEKYEYTSNVVQLTISNDYSPLSSSGTSSNGLVNNQTTSSSSTSSSSNSSSSNSSNSNSTNSTPTNSSSTPTNSPNTNKQNTPSTNDLQTNLHLNHTLNLNDVKYQNNSSISAFANAVNELYSNQLISSLFTSNYDAKDMSISNLVYNNNFSELLSFSFSNNSNIPVSIYNASGKYLIKNIAPHQQITINLQASNNAVSIDSDLNSLTKNSFIYNLQAMYESGNFEQVTNYYKTTEYLDYGYLYPILWNQDNDNCLKYNSTHADYYWNSAETGPSHIYTMNQTSWKAYISLGDSQTIYMTYIAGMLGFNNNILNELNAYSGYVPTNNNNNTLIITKVEVNNTWYSVNFVLNGGSKFYLG